LIFTHHGPDKAGQFPGDCDDRFIGQFASLDQSPITLICIRDGSEI